MDEYTDYGPTPQEELDWAIHNDHADDTRTEIPCPRPEPYVARLRACLQSAWIAAVDVSDNATDSMTYEQRADCMAASHEVDSALLRIERIYKEMQPSDGPCECHGYPQFDCPNVR